MVSGPSSPPSSGSDVKNELRLVRTVCKNLVLGGVAGIIGASCTYPLDLVKTTLQAHRGRGAAPSIVTVVKTVVARGGLPGLYRGLPAQLIGITPEKAIKLTVNDLLRHFFTDRRTGDIKLYHEVLAGGVAGFTQVVATNPYEIVKVRIQTGSGQGVLAIAKELGARGLFTGAGACLLRDVPFTALYFPLYANLKRAARDPITGVVPLHLLFISGIGAGMVASASVTPMDVVKTRLQVRSIDGAVPYKGIRDCFARIIQEEGATALFKGVVPRMMIISPLFGITLLTYEVLQGFFI